MELILTPTILKSLMPYASKANCEKFAEPYNNVFRTFDISTLKRAGMFLAQIAHESQSMLYNKEIWGPTGQQLKYERNLFHAWPPTQRDHENRTAWSLGNSQPGDGKKYMGRAHMMCTGRSNYLAFGDYANYNFIDNPEDLELPTASALFGGWFWSTRGLNKLADTDNFRAICIRINGGSNGLEDRGLHWVRIRNVLNIV